MSTVILQCNVLAVCINYNVINHNIVYRPIFVNIIVSNPTVIMHARVHARCGLLPKIFSAMLRHCIEIDRSSIYCNTLL